MHTTPSPQPRKRATAAPCLSHTDDDGQAAFAISDADNAYSFIWNNGEVATSYAYQLHYEDDPNGWDIDPAYVTPNGTIGGTAVHWYTSMSNTNISYQTPGFTQGPGVSSPSFSNYVVDVLGMTRDGTLWGLDENPAIGFFAGGQNFPYLPSTGLYKFTPELVGDSSAAAGILDDGTTTGISTGGNTFVPLFDASITKLGAIAPSSGGATFGFSAAFLPIVNSGSLPSNATHPFLWSPATGTADFYSLIQKKYAKQVAFYRDPSTLPNIIQSADYTPIMASNQDVLAYGSMIKGSEDAPAWADGWILSCLSNPRQCEAEVPRWVQRSTMNKNDVIAGLRSNVGLSYGQAITYTSAVLLVPVTLRCDSADTQTVFQKNWNTPSNNNPAYFFDPNPPDPTLSMSHELALVILYKDVIDDSFNVYPFTVTLSFAKLLGSSWTEVKGPANPPGYGILENSTSIDARFLNPQVGGLYQFDGVLGSSVTSVRTSLILPLAGAEVKEIVSNDIVKADAFAATVLANYNPLEINGSIFNGRRWFVTNGAGDYRGRADNNGSKTCVRYNPINDNSGGGAVCTWFGVPVLTGKLSNFLVGYASQKIGVWTPGQWAAGILIGTKNDQSADASFQFGIDVASGIKNYSADTGTFVKSIFFQSSFKNTFLWPNSALPDNYVPAPGLVDDCNTQFTSPGFTSMTNP